MSKRYFGHQHTRLIIETFGRLFTNLYYARFNDDASKIERLIRTPCRYLPTSASHMSDDLDNEGLTNFLSVFPRIAYEFKGMTYEANRQLTNAQTFVNPLNADQYGFTPAPYSLQFEVRLAARNQVQALEIIEQILPWYRPTLTVSIKHEVFDDQERDMTVKLESVDFEDNYEAKELRVVEYTLQFSVNTTFWGAVNGTDLEIAKYVECGGVVIEDAISGTPYEEVETVDPGIVPETPGVIKKVIVDWLDYCVKDTADPFFPVIERTALSVLPTTATSKEEVTGYSITVDTDVTIDERKPPV